MSLYDIKGRAQELRHKQTEASISPEEVGGLFADLADSLLTLEREGATLGIRKVYPNIEAMRADTAPTDGSGRPLRRGNLVAIYDEATAATDTNSGLVLMWTGEGYTSVARIGTALRHENTALEARIAQTEGKATALEGVDDELRSSLEELANATRREVERLEREASEAVARTDAKADEALGRLEYTADEQAKVSRLKVDGEAGDYLGGDGAYHALPASPSYSLSVQEGSGRGTQKVTLHGGTEDSFIEIKSGGGSGGGFLNITREVPLGSGYYTLETAVGALQTLGLRAGERGGLIICFESSEGKWEDYRYVGSATSDEAFASVPMWLRYAPEVDTKQIQELIDNSQQRIEVADSVDESDRPVSSRAVKAEFDAVKNFTFDSDKEEVEGGTKVTLTHEGRVVTEFTVAGGGGSTGGATTKAVVTAQLDVTRIPVGGTPTLTYGYTHYSDGAQDGLPADVRVVIKRGTQIVTEIGIGEVTSGETRTLLIGQYVRIASSYTISVVANYIEDGAPKMRVAVASLSVVDLSISLYNKPEIQTYLSAGGYKDGDTANITVQVTGGARELSLYIDGDDQPHETKMITGSGGRQTFVLPIRTFSAGLHNVQIVARLDSVKSNSIYLDVVKAGASRAFVGLLFSRPDGRIMKQGEAPEMIAKQYSALSWEYIAISPSGGVANVTLNTPSGAKSFASPKSYQTATERMMKQGSLPYRYEIEGGAHSFNVLVSETDVAGLGIKEGASLELLAQGRSNSERAPAEWRSGAFSTTFGGVDWSSSGWTGEALRLLNGAKACIDYTPYSIDAKTTGQTIILEFKTTNVRHLKDAVISCYDKEGHASGGFGGFQITPREVIMPFGGKVDFLSENGDTVSRDLGINLWYASGAYYHIAIVVHPESDHKNVRMYIDGVLTKADTYNDTIFSQRTPQGILLDSTGADLEVRHIRIYPTALSDDEVLQNYITDRPTIEEMEELLERNNVLDPQTGEVSWDKLFNKGLGVLNICMDGGLETLWGRSTDTKTRFPVKEIIWRSPLGREFDIKIEDCTVQRQGSSTSTYPHKGMRVAVSRSSSTKVYRNIGKGGVDVWELIPSREFLMRNGSKPIGIINIKTYYADSSMQNDMGGALLWNRLCREIPELTTPAMREDPEARAANDGLPCTLFTSDTPEGDKRFCGTAWFNNDKSKSGYIYGQTKDDGTHIALEGINNTNGVALYTFTEQNVANQLARNGENEDGFDASFEFLYPEKDYVWGTAPENIKQSVVRLMQFIKDCTPSGIDVSRMNTAEVKRRFKSDKFKREIAQYFSVSSLCAWYVWTDYLMAVDQRAKNTFLRTWDGLLWFITFYDGDNGFGITNEAFLSLPYNVTRDTWDPQRGKYAFEGHNSMLWCLVLANLEEELKAIAVKMRGIMTDSVARQYFNSPLRDWCETVHNKSNIYKYIVPTYTDYNGGGKMNYIFALKGTMHAVKEDVIQRRFSLLDAHYNPDDTVRKDNIPCYIGKGNIPTEIVVWAGEEYYFGWGTQNGVVRQYERVEAGQNLALSFPTAISLNDPVRIAGASRISKINLSSTAGYVQGAMNLNLCKMLEELIGPVSGDGGFQWFPLLGGISGLKRIDLTNQKALSGTESAQSLTFDVSSHTGLQELKLRGTAVRAIRIAEGSPITIIELPATLDKLRLRALPQLSMSGIIVADWTSITTLEVAGCPLINWRELVDRCTRLERLRVEGVDIVDDGSLLRKLLSVKGVDASGAGIDTCELIGVVQLTKYIEVEEMHQLKRHYPSLDIRQPEYTVVEFDERASDPANMSNLDNNTGYKFGNKYVPSAHIKAILDARMGVVGKQATDGVMSVYPLHNWDFTKFADSPTHSLTSDVNLYGDDGDFFIYEPEYWYKGVNDYKAKRNIACFAYGNKPSMPDPALTKVVKYTDLDKIQGYYPAIGAQTLRASLTEDTRLNTYVANVSGYRKIRTQMSNIVASVGILFLDNNDRVIDAFSIQQRSGDFISGMYVIHSLPEGCAKVAFGIERLLEEVGPYIVLSNSDELADMEPDWVHHKPVLVGMFKGHVIEGKLRSRLTEVDTYPTVMAGIENWRNLATRAGLKIMTYDVLNCIKHLSIFKHGTRSHRNAYGNSPYWNFLYSHKSGALLTTGFNDVTYSPTNPGQSGYYLTRDGGVSVFKLLHDTAYPGGKMMGYEQLYFGRNTYLGDISVPIEQVTERGYENPGRIVIGNRILSVDWGSGHRWPRNVIFGRYLDFLGFTNRGETSYATQTTGWSSSGHMDIGYVAGEYIATFGVVEGSYSCTGISTYRATETNFTARPMFDGQIVFVASLGEYKQVISKY